MDEQETVGAVIRRRRKRKGWSLATLSKETGIDVGELSKMERDKRGISDKHLHAIAGALETTASSLLKDTAPRPEPEQSAANG